MERYNRRLDLMRQQEQTPKNDNRFALEDGDFYRYLVGPWKRNLEWREFGGSFAHVRTSNTVVLIEEYQRMESTPGVRHLKWSFGKTLEKNDLRFGYIMKFDPKAKNNDASLEWQYSGETCHGQYIDRTCTAVLNFNIRTSTVTATYRIIDADTMALCITEVDEKQRPTIQYGNMYRLDPKLYMPSFGATNGNIPTMGSTISTNKNTKNVTNAAIRRL